MVTPGINGIQQTLGCGLLSFRGSVPAAKHEHHGSSRFREPVHFGAGPEINLLVFAKGKTRVWSRLSYLWLVDPKTALGGQVLTASFTFARLRKQQ